MNEFDCARLETTDGEPVMLKSVKATGDLKGLMFEARVEQYFSNPTDENMEMVYTFPLPWGAVLLGVEVQLAGKHLTGAVVEKQLAEASYEEALSEGNAAIMLEKNHDLSYTLNLGNLASKEDCVIAVSYCQTLQFEQRGLRLLIPTVIAPRFGDAVVDGGLQPHQAPVHSTVVEYPFNIELRLHGALASARVASPSHPVGISHTAVDGSSVLTVSLGRSASLDRDFVLVIDQLAQDSVAVLATDMVVNGGVVALASFCPRVPLEGPATTAVKVLVDCSGSMAGDSINAAKRALQAIILQLGQGDRYSLSRFGSTVEHRSRGLWSATETTRLAAQRWVGNLNADLGGTEMESALSSTFKLAQTVSSDVLLITDGEISAIDKTIDAAKNSGHRLFVVGIGSSPAEGLLRRLAEATGGACCFVSPREAVETSVLSMFKRLRSPHLSDIKVVWPEAAKPVWQSSLPLSVFDGDTVNVYALFNTAPKGEVGFIGRTAETSASMEIGRTQLNTPLDTSTTLSRVAALQRSAASTVDVSEKSKIAVGYQLVTDQTNFLLIHERNEEEKPKDMPALHKVSQMQPAGWGGVGSVMVRESAVACSIAFSNKPMYKRKSSSVDAFDIPAFSRKQSSDIKFSLRETSDDYEVNNAGETPLALSNWLRETPETQWPKSYQELRDISLDQWVIEWLEISVAKTFGKGLTEQMVVTSFLRAMANSKLGASRNDGQQASAGVKGFLNRVVGLMATSPSSQISEPQDVLAAKIAEVLAGMTDTSWPDTVFSLDSATA